MLSHIHHYFLEQYHHIGALNLYRAKVLLNTTLMFMGFVLLVLIAHIIGRLPWFILLSDAFFLFSLGCILGLMRLRYILTASNLLIFLLDLTVALQLFLRDIIIYDPKPHTRFLETEVLLVASLSLVSLCAFKGYQIFLHTLFGVILVIAHFFLIVFKYHQGNMSALAVADIIIYSCAMGFVGILSGYMFQINQKLVMNLEDEREKVRELAESFRLKVEERTKELALQNEELQKANFELDKFVYSVSHDLRSPLTSAMGLITLMKDENNLQSLLYYVKMLEQLLHKLDNLILDILDLSVNSRQATEKEWIDLHKIFDDIFESHKFNSRLKYIDRQIDIDQDAPFYSDRRRLVIIFNNLIANAIKYSQEREGTKSYIHVKVNCTLEQAHFEIHDNGQGIEAEHLPRIFEMFYRATTNSHGSGLGLYIVRETLNKLRGHITVQSEEGTGTVFTLDIPNAYQEVYADMGV